MSTALYRRYRPETFADVIGQEHVTDPLMAAIDKDRINHAYLFSGPRGCGKTTSARILARCLNCAQGPTSTPCGVCDSCVELARNGSGSLDVIEIDAASHGGVDDARDLRERATFAPVRDRFKIFIIDEAHMVTSAGFNALLKIVEEPPEHILFIFATTEPDKVIGTIRSRTHHYPFRLVPPEPLMGYLELLCRQENVPVAPGVLSLVIRAGGGSVRDSLSVLDQLMAGAGEAGLDYELAVSLLGYTHATLLDDVVESIAAGDAGTVFDAVDRVIQTGHDPRRFVEDLLERFRDLIVINAVPEGASSILRGVPDDQLNRMRTQATQLGAGELSRAADITNTALTEMTGATSPRLHLELLCARLLLPAADASVRGTLARVDRIERRLEYAGGATATTSPAASSETRTQADAEPARPVRPRLDVPRNAEEAAARWSLPAGDPAAPAVPAAVPGAHSPAVPAAVRPDRAGQGPSAADSSADWGGAWGVSTDTAFADAPAGQKPSGSGPAAPGAGPASSGAASAPASSADEASSAEAPAAGRPGGPSVSTDSASPSYPPDTAQSGPRSSDDNRPGAPASGQPTSQPAAAGPAAQRPPAVQDERGPVGGPVDARGPVQDARPEPTAEHRPDPGSQGAPPARGGGNVEMVRRAWPEIMDEVAKIKRATWLIVNMSAKPRSFEGNQLVLAFANQGTAIGFQRGPHMDNVKQAIHKVLGLTCSIEAVHDADGAGESGPKVPADHNGPGSPGPGSSTPTVVPRRSPAPGAADAPAPSPTAPAPAAAPGSAVPSPRAAPAGPAPSSRTRPSEAGTDAPRHDPANGQGPAPSAAPSHVSRSSRPDSAGRDAHEDPAGAAPPSNLLERRTGTSSPAPGTDPPSSTPGAQGPSRGPAPASPDVSPSQATFAASGTRPDQQRRPAAKDPRDAAGSDARSETRQEAVGAWDPSMSDDSWALVEPPEDAFDPGPAWGSVPEDPYDGRSPSTRGNQPSRTGPGGGQRGGRAAQVPGTPPQQRSGSHPAVPGGAEQRPGRPTRAGSLLTERPAGGDLPGRGSEPQRPSGTDTAGRADQHSPTPADRFPQQGPHPAGQPDRQAPERTASRSVVWSPPTTAPAPSPESEAETVELSDAERDEAPQAQAPQQETGPSRPAGSPGGAGPAGPVIPSFIRRDTSAAGTDAALAAAGPVSTARGSAAVVGPGGTAQGTGGPSDRPTAADNVLHKPVSRYQQLLDEAERKRVADAAAVRGTADLRFVDDEPSADDETIEESGLVGRTAIERILNGRLVEERSLDGQ